MTTQRPDLYDPQSHSDETRLHLIIRPHLPDFFRESEAYNKDPGQSVSKYLLSIGKHNPITTPLVTTAFTRLYQYMTGERRLGKGLMVTIHKTEPSQYASPTNNTTAITQEVAIEKISSSVETSKNQETSTNKIIEKVAIRRPAEYLTAWGWRDYILSRKRTPYNFPLIPKEQPASAEIPSGIDAQTYVAARTVQATVDFILSDLLTAKFDNYDPIKKGSKELPNPLPLNHFYDVFGHRTPDKNGIDELNSPISGYSFDDFFDNYPKYKRNIIDSFKFPQLPPQILVLHHGRGYLVDVAQADEFGKFNLLTIEQIQQRLDYIKDDAKGINALQAIDATTCPTFVSALDKKHWAETYDKIKEVDPDTLKKIHGTIFTLRLDDQQSSNIAQKINIVYDANGRDNLYNGAGVQISVSQDGQTTGYSFEHSAIDGSDAGKLINQINRKIKYQPAYSPTQVSDLSPADRPRLIRLNDKNNQLLSLLKKKAEIFHRKTETRSTTNFDLNLSEILNDAKKLSPDDAKYVRPDNVFQLINLLAMNFLTGETLIIEEPVKIDDKQMRLDMALVTTPSGVKYIKTVEQISQLNKTKDTSEFARRAYQNSRIELSRSAIDALKEISSTVNDSRSGMGLIDTLLRYSEAQAFVLPKENQVIFAETASSALDVGVREMLSPRCVASNLSSNFHASTAGEGYAVGYGIDQGQVGVTVKVEANHHAALVSRLNQINSDRKKQSLPTLTIDQYINQCYQSAANFVHSAVTIALEQQPHQTVEALVPASQIAHQQNTSRPTPKPSDNPETIHDESQLSPEIRQQLRQLRELHKSSSSAPADMFVKAHLLDLNKQLAYTDEETAQIIRDAIMSNQSREVRSLLITLVRFSKPNIPEDVPIYLKKISRLLTTTSARSSDPANPLKPLFDQLKSQSSEAINDKEIFIKLVDSIVIN